MRWLRALRLLEARHGARVLDLGCAFGFGTRMLTREYIAFGLDSSPSYIQRAARTVARASFMLAQAEQIPFGDGTFDAVVCLDVIEHLCHEAPAISEIGRVLKPRGELILSVPHTGALQAWDSLNRYLSRTGRPLSFPLEELPSGSPWHRHYSLAELGQLLHGFEIDRVQLTAIGLAEIFNGILLWLPPRWYQKLQALYFTLAVAEDNLPLGRHAYNIMIHARKVV